MYIVEIRFDDGHGLPFPRRLYGFATRRHAREFMHRIEMSGVVGSGRVEMIGPDRVAAETARRAFDAAFNWLTGDAQQEGEAA